MACIFRLGLVRFTDLFKVFESYFQFPFQKIAPYIERHLMLLRLAWSNCSSDFTPLQATLNDAYSRFSTLGSTTVPSGSRTTKNICRIGPLVVSEKETSQNGTGCVRNSCVSSAPICA